MEARLIALSVPFFFVLIAVELLVNRRQGDLRYGLHDAVTSIGCGIGQQLLGLFYAALPLACYGFVHEHLRLATISPRSPLAWLVLLFALDLGYYAYHRASHRVGFLWASHVVHHQSEEYNLSTALRQSWLTGLTSWLFYLPLAVAGFPTVMFVTMLTLNTLYQFWIHTRAVGRLGWLESFLNTPSHHRVHHGVDPIYIDRNYAGIFIVWDRLFGTFQREEREPVYGTVAPLASWNPVWANVEHWVVLARRARRTRRLRDKLLVWLMPPEWRPADLGGPVDVPEPDRARRRKFETPAPRGLDVYVVVQFALATAATTAVLAYQAALSAAALAGATAVVVLGLAAWGGLFEAKRWAVPLEQARHAASVALAAWLAAGTPWFAPVVAAGGACAVTFAMWVGRYRGRHAVAFAPTESASRA